mgnify:CR=1 FL=1
MSLEVCRGEVHGVIGENGAGKSTLMNTIFGSLQRDEGTIRFMGEEVHFKCPADALKAGISMIHQETNLVQQFTASENIWLGMEERFIKGGHLDNAARDRKTQELFDEYGISLRYNDVAGQVSMAACQMIEVIRAVACDAKLIIMDEPTSSLSVNEVKILFRMIRRLTEQGVAIIYISHKIEEIMEICDRLSVYRDGHYIGTKAISEIDHNTIVSMVVGRELTNLFPKSEPNIGEVILDVQNLSRYGKFRDVSFQLHKGEIIGIYGLNDQGQSLLLDSIFGRYSYVDKVIELNGKPVNICDASDAVWNGLSFLPERGLKTNFNGKSIAENMMAQVMSYKEKSFFVKRKHSDDLAASQVDRFGIRGFHSVHDRMTSLSGGNIQKVLMTRIMLNEPRVMMLIEPTHGIDIGAKKLLLDYLVKLNREKGVTVVVITHNSAITPMADRVIHIKNGTVESMQCNEHPTSVELIEW